jgi:hypothetical protein
MYIQIYGNKGDIFVITNVYEETVTFSWTCISEDLTDMSAAVFFCVPPPTTLSPGEKKRFRVSVKYEETLVEPKAWWERNTRASRFSLEFVLNNSSDTPIIAPRPHKLHVIPFKSQTRAKSRYMYYGRPLKAVYVNVVDEGIIKNIF